MSPFSGSVADRYILHAASTLYHTWKGSVVASPPLQINTRTLAATQIAYQYGTRFGRSNSAIDFTEKDLVYSDLGSLRCRLILRQIVLLHSRDTILVWPVVYGRSCFEIPMPWRRRNCPFKRRRPPRIFRSFRSFEDAIEKIDQERNRRQSEGKCTHTNKYINRLLAPQVIV